MFDNEPIDSHLARVHQETRRGIDEERVRRLVGDIASAITRIEIAQGSVYEGDVLPAAVRKQLHDLSVRLGNLAAPAGTGLGR